MVCMYCSSKGISRYSFTSQVAKEARVMTKVTAMPMPVAVSKRLDTPRKGQMPRNLFMTKLFISRELTRMTK